MIYTLTLNPALDMELVVPELTMDQVLRTSAVHTDLGGKGFNISRALLAMGTASVALGFIGGSIGEQLCAGLTRLGVKCDFVRVNEETRINLSVVNQAGTHYLKVNEPGPIITNDDAAALLEKITRLVQPGDWWVIAGSSPPGITDKYISNTIQSIQAAGGHAILDATGKVLESGCASGAYLVKPNAFEASELLGSEINSIDQALEALPRIHAIGAQQVAISLGKLGAAYSDGQATWWSEAAAIRERNPIGAGDAMLAGMLWALNQKLDGGEALKWGMACGAAAASLDGTAVGSFELVEFYSRELHVHAGRKRSRK